MVVLYLASLTGNPPLIFGWGYSPKIDNFQINNHNLSIWRDFCYNGYKRKAQWAFRMDLKLRASVSFHEMKGEHARAGPEEFAVREITVGQVHLLPQKIQ